MAASNAARVSGRAAVHAQSPQQTAVRPQGLQVVLVLGEQDASLVVQPAFQQGGEQQVSHTLVVAGVQLQQCPIMCERLVVTPQVSECLARPSRARMYGRVSRCPQNSPRSEANRSAPIAAAPASRARS